MSEHDRDKIKNFREWLNLAVSIIAALGVPLGLLILHNQKLEIERDIAREFVTKIEHSGDIARLQTDDNKQNTNIALLQTKIDLLVIEQVRIGDNITVLREKMALLTKP